MVMTVVQDQLKSGISDALKGALKTGASDDLVDMYVDAEMDKLEDLTSEIKNKIKPPIVKKLKEIRDTTNGVTKEAAKMVAAYIKEIEDHPDIKAEAESLGLTISHVISKLYEEHAH